MAKRIPRIVWTDATLRRLAIARADGVPAAELAARFGVAPQTLDRKLAEMRTADPDQAQLAARSLAAK